MYKKWHYTFAYAFVMISVVALTAVVVSADTGTGPQPARAVDPSAPVYSNQTVDRLESLIKLALAQQYAGARIELDKTKAMLLVQGPLPEQIDSVGLLNEPIRGEGIFSINNGAAQVRASYMAWVSAWIAKSRIYPDQRLSSDMFIRQDVNVATGMAYEMKGLILPQEESVASLQTRQTVMEGQFLVSSAVEKIPDVRKGDDVRIHIISGDLNLTAGGIAAEPGYINNTIKVIVAKTKHELTGELLPDGVVEVKLQ